MSEGVGEKLLKALLRPQVMVAFLLALFALAFLLASPRSSQPSSVKIGVEPPAEREELREATLILVDESGLERERTALVPGGGGPTAELNALLSALKEALQEIGVWPASLEAPRAFLVQERSGNVAVIDLLMDAPPAVSVDQELALERSLTATALRSGVMRVRYLRNGEPTRTLISHVAVSSDL